jgi:NADPH:quinone reductase
MLAIRVDEFGDPSVLRPVEVPSPTAGDGEVVVAVEAAGVLSLDVQIRRGAATAFGVSPPYIPGRGAAGTVIAGSSAWVGRRVLVDGPSTYAAEVAAPLSSVLEVPAALGAADAMALLHDGGTALAVLERTGVRPGENVLILPAAGGAGSVLLQLARAAGARVIGAARGPLKLQLARSLGADLVVDYGEPGWAEVVRRRVGQVDVVFDGVGPTLGTEAFGLVADGGRYSNYGAAGGAPSRVTSPDVAVVGMEQLGTFAAGRRSRQERILAEAAAGRIHPVVAREFELAKAADAHTALENREIAGKALLIP